MHVFAVGQSETAHFVGTLLLESLQMHAHGGGSRKTQFCRKIPENSLELTLGDFAANDLKLIFALQKIGYSREKSNADMIWS